jgi:hypothetical protein
MMLTPTITEAMTSAEWFGAWFGGEDWRPWRIFAAAVFGLEIDDPTDLAFYQERTGRTKVPTERAREVYAVVGRRGGKSRVCAFIAAYLAAFVDWRPYLVPGESAAILLFAKDRQQAAVSFRYLRSFFDHPALAELIAEESSDEIALHNGVVVQVATASFRSGPRSRTVCAAFLDELAFWFDAAGESANPAEEVLAALRPAMLTMPGALLMAASSPYAKRGPLYEAHRRYWGVAGRRLIWHGATLDMHPSLAGDTDALQQMAEEREADPARAASEYDAIPRDDVANFLDRDRLEALVVRGLRMREPQPGIAYVCFVDASAGGADSYAAAIGHRDESGAIHSDCILEFPPGTSPEAATAAIVEVARTYGITAVVGDNFAKRWVQDAFAALGIRYDRCERVRSDVYLEAAASFANGRVRLLEHPRSIAQLATLERRVHRGGKDSVGHVPGGHDDLANVICGIVYLLSGDRVAPTLIDRHDLVVAEGEAQPVRERPLLAIFALLWVDPAGVAAWVVMGVEYATHHPIRVLAFDRKPMTVGIITEIVEQLDALAESARDRQKTHWAISVGVWVPQAWAARSDAELERVFVPRVLARRHERRNVVCEPLASGVAQQLPAMAYSAQAHTSSGLVKIGAGLLQDERLPQLMTALTFTASDRLDADPLRAAAIMAISMALDAAGEPLAPAWAGARLVIA